jgi:hypothetical protein
MIKESLSSSFQLLGWCVLNLGDFVKLPILAKCPKPSWSFGQLQAARRGEKESPHRHGARKPMGARGDSGPRQNSGSRQLFDDANPMPRKSPH